MARKTARAVAATEAAEPDQYEEQKHASISKVPLSDLSPKSCLTCGRVITPRAKWAKGWEGIKYCSDRCRSTRPGKVVVRFSTSSDLVGLGTVAGVKVEGSGVIVDLETFVEATILHAAGEKEATLEDTQDRIKAVLAEASITMGQPQGGETTESEPESEAKSKETNNQNDNMHPLWKALDSPPGFRERVRRAARRLALGITHDSDSEQTNIVTTEKGKIELLQRGKPLRTVEELSFAKGTLYIRRR